MSESLVKIRRIAERIAAGRKKVLTAVFIAAGALILLWLLVYLPQILKLRALRLELRQSELKIRQSAALTSGGQLAGAIKEVRENFARLKARLPSDSATLVELLSQEARKYGLGVKEVIPADGGEVSAGIAGYRVQEVPLVLSLNAEYRALGRFLEAMQYDFPLLVRVDQLKMRNAGQGQALLEVELQIAGYIAQKL